MVHGSFCLLDFRNLQAREGKQDHLKEVFRRLMGCPRCFYWAQSKKNQFLSLWRGSERESKPSGEGLSLFLGFLFLSFKLLLSGDLHPGENVVEMFNVVKFLPCSSLKSLSEISVRIFVPLCNSFPIFLCVVSRVPS